MAAWSSGLQQSALLMLFFTLMSAFTHAAPLSEQSTEMGYSTSYSNGCYYNFQHYDEGDRILTNEPCLNCTCHNEMLMCYLRVCPFTKAIGQDCKVEKRPDQCCPTITCPEVPVKLVPSTTPSTAVGHMNEYGCFIDSLFYTDGARVPSNPNKPCELCYCIRNRTACVMQECTLKIEGCKPVYQEGVCCPAKYDCEYPEQNLLDTTTTTTERTTPAIITTTMLPGSQVCVFNNEIYADGALINKDVPCQYCYCMKGDIVCAVQECNPTPLEKINCTALPAREGQCCPDTYDCDNLIEEELTTLIYESTTPRIDDLDNEIYATKPDAATEKPTYAPAGHVPKLDEVLPEVTKHPEYVHTTEKLPLTKLPEIVTEEYITSEKMTESHAQVTEHSQPLTTVKEEPVVTSDKHEEETELTATDFPSRFGEEETSSPPKAVLTTSKPIIEEHTQKQPEDIATSSPVEKETAVPSKPIDITTSAPDKVESTTLEKEKAAEKESTKISEPEVKPTEPEPYHTTSVPSKEESTTVIKEEIIPSEKEFTKIPAEESKHTTKLPIEKDSTAEEPKHTSVSPTEKDLTELPIEKDLTADKEPKQTTVSSIEKDLTTLSKEEPKHTTVSSTEKDLVSITEEPKHATVSSIKEEFTTVAKEESKPTTLEEDFKHTTKISKEKDATTEHELKHTTVSPGEKDLTTIDDKEEKHTTISPSEKYATTISEKEEKHTTVSPSEKDATILSEKEEKHTTVSPSEKDATTVFEKEDKHTTVSPSEKDATTLSEKEEKHTTVSPSEKDATTVFHKEEKHTTVSPSEKDATTMSEKEEKHTTVSPSEKDATTIFQKEEKHTTVSPSEKDATTLSEKEEEHIPVSPSEKDATTISEKEEKHTTVSPSKKDATTISEKEEGHTTVSPSEKYATTISEKEEKHTTVSPSEKDATTIAEKEEKHATVSPSEKEATTISEKEEKHATVVPSEKDTTIISEKEEKQTTVSPIDKDLTTISGEQKHTTISKIETTVFEEEPKHTTGSSLEKELTVTPKEQPQHVSEKEATTSEKVPSTTLKSEPHHTTVSPSEKESTTKKIGITSGEESTTFAVEEPKHTTVRLSEKEVTTIADVESKQTTVSTIEKGTTFKQELTKTPEEITTSVKDEHTTSPTVEKEEEITKSSVDEPKHTTVFEEEITKKPVEEKIQPASITPIGEDRTKVPEKELEKHTTPLSTEEFTKPEKDVGEHTTLTSLTEDASKHTSGPVPSEEVKHTTVGSVASEESKHTDLEKDIPTTISFGEEKVTTEASKHVTIAPVAQETKLDKEEKPATTISSSVSEETTHVPIKELDKESSTSASPHKEEPTTVIATIVPEDTTHVPITEHDKKEEYSTTVSYTKEKPTTVSASPVSEETTHVSLEKESTTAPIEEKITTLSPGKDELPTTVSEDKLTKSPEEHPTVSEKVSQPEHIDDKEVTKPQEQTTIKHDLETKPESAEKPEGVTEPSLTSAPGVTQTVTKKDEATEMPVHPVEKEHTTLHSIVTQPEEDVTTEISTPDLGNRLAETTDEDVEDTSEHTTISHKPESAATSAEEQTTIVSVPEVTMQSDKVTTHKPVVTTISKEDIPKTTESESEEVPERDDQSGEEDIEEHTSSSHTSVTESHVTLAHTEKITTVAEVSTKKDLETHVTEVAESEVTPSPKEVTKSTIDTDKETHVTKLEEVTKATDELTTLASSSKLTTVEELTKVSEETTHPTVREPEVTTILQIKEEPTTPKVIKDSTVKAEITTALPIKHDEENDIEYSTSAEPVYTVTPERLPATEEQTTTPSLVITEDHKPAEEHPTEIYSHITDEPIVTVTAVVVDTETPKLAEEEKTITEQPNPIEEKPTTAASEVSAEPHTTQEPILTAKPEVIEKVTLHDIHLPAKESVTTVEPVTTEKQIEEKPKHPATTQTPTEVTKLPEKVFTITPIETTSVETEVTKVPKEQSTEKPVEKEPSENEISTEDKTIVEPITEKHVTERPILVEVRPEEEAITKVPSVFVTKSEEVTDKMYAGTVLPTTEKHITEQPILVEVKPVEEAITKVPSVLATTSEEVTDKVYAGTELPSIVSSTDGQLIEEKYPSSESTTKKELVFTVKPIAVTEAETVIPLRPDQEYIPPQVLEEATREPESADTEKTTAVPEKTTTEHVVPGEGSCLVDGLTYENNTNVPPINHCQISCVCISSILQCTSVTCSPAPSNLHNCMPLYHGPDSCCPTYSCTVPEPTEIESDSHKMEDTTIKEQPVTVSIQVLPAESKKPEATTQPDVSKSQTQQSTEVDVPKVFELTTPISEVGTKLPITEHAEVHTTEGKITSKLDQEEIVTVTPSKSVQDEKTTAAPEEHVTLEDRFEKTTVSEEEVTKLIESVPQSITHAPKHEEPIHVPVIIEKLPEEEKSHTTAAYEHTTIISTEKPKEATHEKEEDVTTSPKVVVTTESIESTTVLKQEKPTTPYESVEHITTVEDKKSESTEESVKSPVTESVTVPEKESEITEAVTQKSIPGVSSTSVYVEEQPKVTTEVSETEAHVTTLKPSEHVTEGLKEEETKYPYSKPSESVTESVESHTERKESETTTSHGPLITTLRSEIPTIKDKEVPTEPQKSTEPSVTESDKGEHTSITSASKEPEVFEKEHTTKYPEALTTPAKVDDLEVTSKVDEIKKEYTTVSHVTEEKTEQEVRIPATTVPSFTDRIDIGDEESEKELQVTTVGKAAEPELTTYYPKVPEVTTHVPLVEKESEKPEIYATEKAVESVNATQKLPEVTTVRYEISSSSQEPFSSTSLSSLLTEAVLNHTELYTSTPQYPTITESTSLHSDFSEHTPEAPDYHIPPEDEYEEEDHGTFGPGTCRYGGKMYVSAQQIPRDDPCDFCFCFRSDIICLQQSCPPPIPRCHEEPIRGFCCPRYECPVSMATAVNITTTTTTTTTTLPPIFFSHAYKGRATRQGCQIQGRDYQIGEEIISSSGPCLQCKCGGDGQMKCDPKPCSPEPMIRKMIAEATSRRRR